ncbi:Down syndrome cell adhesion molecule-like protein Dscam2 [Rhizophagus clarus]|uniref:Down syndrome cell adhesion molecule-like protein Dscam2 n=1 Tax=Rhizophagus clarus TaxID=94130 RepID=A0A8H3QK27_9GLOM|nr:Down syndrome cell adhesion molecule-like protein Dscam2 [Rhizophagus clarus]
MTTVTSQPHETTETTDTRTTSQNHNSTIKETTEDQMNIDPTDFYPSHDPTATTATNTTTTTTPTTTNTIDQEMIKEVQVINKDRTLDTKNNIQRNRHPENDGNVGGLVGKRKLQIVQKEENNLTLKTKKRIKKGKNNKQIKIQKDHYKKDSDMKQDNDNKQYNFKKYNMNLKIGCINIRGLNDSNNQLNLRRIITNEKWDIAIVTKTKLNNQKGQHIFKDWESYDCLNCSYNKFEQKKGIMIIIRKELSQRKVNIERINDKEKTNKIKRKIIDWVEEAEKLNQELIILDDFNKADKATNRMNRLITKCFNNLTLHDINRCLAGDEVLDTWMNTEILNFDKNSMIKEIKKQKNWIKLDTEDWETIAATVEEQIMKEDTQLTINWNTIVGIYQNTHQEIIEKKKLNIEEENKAMENCLNEEILYKNPQLYIKNMIIERDRFLYLEYIGHHIEKFLNKLLDKLYNKHYRETAKNFQLAKRTYIAISTFPNWNEDNMIKKKNKLKIESLVKLYNNKEIIEDKKLDIDKLRDLMFRKSFKENIGKIEQTCNEMTKDIINMNIDINIRTRETYLENDIGKMINRILERKKEKIDMSNLFIRENRIFTIETDKQKIKERVHNHYKEWMKKRNIDLDLIEFNKEWRNNYQPITEINEQIYDSILEDITIEELDNIIKETKSGKAAGISGIPHDFWKKSKKETRKILLNIYNGILHEHKVLNEWKKGMIFPINKTTLKRLAKILSSNKILQGFNYAALLNESTLEPPKIVQSIVKDANKEKKEVWILLMDISKAFDSVSMIMLEKSLKRIKIPESLIEIIMDINLNRTNKVIVNSEFTKEYKVEDGVDQEITYNALAFMDDTMLIGGNKHKLLQIIEICHEFFEINDIKANIKKYELIRINSSKESENNDLIINNEKIEKVNNPEGN